jgi:hypothetical protein
MQDIFAQSETCFFCSGPIATAPGLPENADDDETCFCCGHPLAAGATMNDEQPRAAAAEPLPAATTPKIVEPAP